MSLNPGATTRGIHDSLVNYLQNKDPEIVLCCHEEIAVAIASGYFRATRKPMAILLHDIAGLLHSTKAIFDAWLNRDAMLLIGGNGPANIEERRPWIDWIHNSLIPNTAVRDFTKWDDQPTDIISTLEGLVRGYNISVTEPSGPVFISIDAGIQESRLNNQVTIPAPESYPRVTIDEGSSEALAKVANLLVLAEKPVIIVQDYGRDDASVGELVQLAELLGAAVLDTGAEVQLSL